MELEVVWRTLADEALDGRRSWPTTRALAVHAQVGEPAAVHALRRLVAVGVVQRHAPSGFAVVDPERLLVSLAVRHHLSPRRVVSRDAARELVESDGRCVLGGSWAAVHHLGGVNTVASHADWVVYVPDGVGVDVPDGGVGAGLFTADPRWLAGSSDGFVSRAVAFTDLFNIPGWQASEFRRALWRVWFEDLYWDAAVPR